MALKCSQLQVVEKVNIDLPVEIVAYFKFRLKCYLQWSPCQSATHLPTALSPHTSHSDFDLFITNVDHSLPPMLSIKHTAQCTCLCSGGYGRLPQQQAHCQRSRRLIVVHRRHIFLNDDCRGEEERGESVLRNGWSACMCCTGQCGKEREKCTAVVLLLSGF